MCTGYAQISRMMRDHILMEIMSSDFWVTTSYIYVDGAVIFSGVSVGT